MGREDTQRNAATEVDKLNNAAVPIGTSLHARCERIPGWDKASIQLAKPPSTSIVPRYRAEGSIDGYSSVRCQSHLAMRPKMFWNARSGPEAVWN